MKDLFLLVARNSFFGAFSKLSIKLIAFAFTIFIARWLGDENYGRYALIWSYVVVFSLFSDIGLDLYAIREIAKRQSESQNITSNIIVLRLVLASVTILLIVIVTQILDYPKEFLLQVFLASLILPLYAIQDPLDATLQANERFDISAVAIITGLVVFIASGIVLLMLGWGITGVIMARLFNVIVSAALSWKLLTNYKRDLKWQIEPILWPEFIRFSLPFGLIKLWLDWSLRIDVIILAWFWTEQTVGWYGAAYNLVLGVIVISSSVNAALYPTLSRQYTQSSSLMPKIYEVILKYFLMTSLPLTVVISLVANRVVFLIYGGDFTSTGTILSVLIWIFPLVSISEFFRYVLLAKNEEKVAVQNLLVTVLFHITLNLLLIPIYGFLGAAVAAVTSEVILLLLYIWKLSPELKSINLINILLKPLLPVIILGIIIKGLSGSSLFTQISLGSGVYLFSIWFLGLVKIDEFKQLFYSLKNNKQSLPGSPMHENTKSTPLISIFIPVYNAEEYISQAIESVLTQTYANYELIVVDDGSTDHTADILENYHSHPKITLHRNSKNQGMAANWNIGLSLCRGELIAKLDADDFYEPHYLEALVEFTQKHPSVGLIFSGLNLIYSDGRQELEMRFLRSWVGCRETFLPALLQSCIVRSPTVCVRRRCYEQLGGFIEELRIHADWEMWIRIACHHPVGFIAQRLANYRQNHGTNCTARAITEGWSIEDVRLWLDLLEKGKLPYHLTSEELFQFRWGIYNLEMHFAAISAYHQHEGLQKAYTAFAEEVVAQSSPSSRLEELRWTYTNLHKGIYAFRDNKPKEAWGYVLQSIKPRKTSQPWYKLVLTCKIIKRLLAGLSHHLLIKYYRFEL